MNVIPKPANVVFFPGSFMLNEETEILFNTESPNGKTVAEFLAQRLAAAIRFSRPPRPVSSRRGKSGSILLLEGESQTTLGEEGYELLILPDQTVLRAPKAAGLFYAAQTLRQLLPSEIESGKAAGQGRGKWEIPCAHITDQPRFGWRGLLLDCSRTFQPIERLKRYIDLLAYYKMNVIHLHLTDDQGWRIEIKKHPELTRSGSQFEAKYHEPGGFYTQDDLRDLIAYAASRQVQVVPEIEMPGHCLAALKVHPELSCTGGPFEIYPFFKGPYIQEHVFCAGNDRVFELLEDALSEVVEVFPAPCVHIGGDEVPKAKWKECAKCQARLKAEGLKDEQELQSYFIRRIAKFLGGKNRRVIGWDEILEGGLAEGATVMSWRGMEGGLAAIGAGHDVVFSPTSHCYFDYDYDQISLEKTYSFEPVSEGLSAEQRAHILGVQANMWTHLARNEASLDQQVFPRLAALAEIGWSPRAGRDWRDFAQRMETHYERLDRLGVNYKRAAEGWPDARG